MGDPSPTCRTCGEPDEGDGSHRCSALASTQTPIPGKPSDWEEEDTTASGGKRRRKVTARVSDPHIGKLLAEQYRVLELIGSGGMGTVYLVEHIHLKKRFAAKVLNGDMAKKPDALARFELEALSASKLDHDNIVSVVNFGRSDDTVFLIMELLRGQNLEQKMRKGPLSWEELVRIVVPVCRALGAAHEAGIVHRDLKPENVFLARKSDGRCVVKVLDFGVSKIKETKLADARLTQTGQVLGSPLYMSPEASRGATDIDHRADIYAVGIMLYELSTGKAPFVADNYLQVLHMHVNDTPRAPRVICPEIPEELEQVILHALEKQRELRTQTMAELADELCAVFPDISPDVPLIADVDGNTASPVDRRTPVPGSGTHQRQRTGQQTAQTVPPKPVKARTWPWMAIAALGVAAAIAAMVVIITSGGAKPKPAAEIAQGGPQQAPAPAPTPTPTPTPAPTPPPAAPTNISLTVASTPPGASASLDGKPLGTTPFTITVPVAAGMHELVLARRGFVVDRSEIALDRDLSVSRALRAAHGGAVKPPPPYKPPLEIKGGR